MVPPRAGVAQLVEHLICNKVIYIEVNNINNNLDKD